MMVMKSHAWKLEGFLKSTREQGLKTRLDKNPEQEINGWILHNWIEVKVTDQLTKR